MMEGSDAMLREIIEGYVPQCEQEVQDRRMMLKYMDLFPDDILTRQNEIAHFTALYNTLGLKAQVEAQISDYFDRAMGYFNQLQVAPERLEVLKEICHRLMHRQS